MKTLVRTISALTLFVLISGILSTYAPLSQASSVFSDTAGHTYENSIEFLYNRGVVQGYPDGSFGPDREVNRAEIMKIILEASVSDDIGHGLNCFPDVRGEWFAKYICYGKDNNIIKGYPDGKFKPGQNVNIAEALKMGLESFSANISSTDGQWYEGYLNFVHDNNIFSKYGLRPGKNMTRGQMAFLIHQLMLEEEDSIEFTGERSIRSAGCGKTAPSPTPTSSVVDGRIRNYITVIGNKYNKDTPTKLILAFHGRTNPNTMVRTYYKVEEASKGEAIIVYPAGLPEEGPSRSWSNPGDRSHELRDFALFDQLVEEFTSNYCVNLDQIFVVGHSLGAWFTNTLACARGDVIRATGSVGGGTTINDCSGPVAAMIMHNPEDRLAPFSSGVTARDQMLSQNSCGAATVSMGPANGNCVKYTECQADAPVIWCPHSDSTDHRGVYYPHTWPDFAGTEIWNFLASQE